MAYKLTRASRILKLSEYRTIFENGKMVKNKYWQIIAQNVRDDRARLGIIVSKKIYNLAVDRNRLKRIVKEVFRLEQNNFKNWCFIVMVKKSKLTQNSILYSELTNLFYQSLKR